MSVWWIWHGGTILAIGIGLVLGLTAIAIGATGRG